MPVTLNTKNTLYIYFIDSDFLKVKTTIIDTNLQLSKISKALKIPKIIENLFYFNSDCEGIDVFTLRFDSIESLNASLCISLKGLSHKLINNLKYQTNKLILILKTHNE